MALLATLLASCPGAGGVAAAAQPSPTTRLGGDTTVNADGADAFSLPAANMPLTGRGDFFTGNAFFQQPWVTAPSSTAGRDGLGPHFNLNACQGCHVHDGRGRAPRTGKPLSAALVRISIPLPDVPSAEQREAVRRAGALPEPTYGGQLQPFAINGLAGEPKPRIEWTSKRGEYADGTAWELRRPRLRFETGAGQVPLAANVQTSIRTAPPMIGLGLLGAIPAADIEAGADPADSDGDGISGRSNRVWQAVTESMALGRFGWKANVPSVRQQTAAAFHGDMGLTTSLFPEAPCSAVQAECLAAKDGGDPEVSDEIFDLIVAYANQLAVPRRRNADDPAVERGARLFTGAGCAACHTPTQRTGERADFATLANQTIHPYTDLLLHDMGPGLADGRPDFRADGREWRTPPLWGIGLTGVVNDNRNYLHDGRARTLAEAILWHGGEAAAARDAFRDMDETERAALIAFLQSL